MKSIGWLSLPGPIADCALAVLSVAVTTVLLASIGRDTLGVAVVALLYLAPVAWSSARWGLVPGACAASAATLAFGFFFTLSRYSSGASRMESWLALGALSVAAVLVVLGIQSGLRRARTAIFRGSPDAPAHAGTDRILSILAAPDLAGEIHLWAGSGGWFPPEEVYLFEDPAIQAALALERARPAEAGESRPIATPTTGVNYRAFCARLRSD
jgi:hypothetical protein